jgi:ATP-binding cassette, subfamily B, vacuolar membrane transporter HMT1/ACLQ
VASFFAWGLVLVSLIDSKPAPTMVHMVTWLFALPLELIIIGASLSIYTVPHREPTIGDPQGGKLHHSITGWEVLEVCVYFCRVALLLGASIIFLVYKIGAKYYHSQPGTPSSDDDRSPLLGRGDDPHAKLNGHAYGTNKSDEPKEPDAWAKPTETPSVNWYQYLKGYMVLVPYLWPSKSRKLQLLALICFGIMVAQRVINVLVPVLTGAITSALAREDGKPIQTPWLLISLYILCRWLQGGQGLLNAARSILWIPVEQYSYRAISNAAFVHVHGLSAEFHTGKRTGEVISALNKGSSINSFLSYITFNVGPMIFDLIVAVVYLTITFDIYVGLVVAVVTFLYVYVTIRLAQWRVTLRRNAVNSERDMEAVKNDSLHSWDTVKYFNSEQYEFNRYRGSILVFQGYTYWLEVTLSVMNISQGALFMLALLVACFIVAYQVARGYQTVSNFVLLITYMTQLQQPLNFFGTFYRAIQQSLINAERLLELFKEQPTVVDRPDVTELTTCDGDIVFDSLTFGYDKRKPALNSLSFHCQPGTTTALVGESGGGKTTAFRMLFRYYNPDSGRILIDGQDVQSISIDSLRSHIGVVPQDCNMFNESIMYNLRYANQSSTDEEVFAACRAAAIHDRIIAFPDGYNTKVGERGVRLSGGERQRVAIARTILKNPSITLLDEATAALDTETEEKIKSAFDSLSSGRTTIIIAHRLSTIVDADQILVLSGGTVVESGTHTELMQLEGKYASMWRKQSRAQKAAVEAEELRERAKKALEAAEVDSANVSEDEIERVKGRKKGHKRGASSRKAEFSTDN